MQFSLEWLRELSPFDDAPERVSDALTARGLTVDALERSGEDQILELDIPANRPDCLGHRGVARELSAALGVPLKAPRSAPPDGDGPDAGASIRVQIEAPRLCGRYTARVVRGVTIGPSPDWVVRRLELCGVRSINNVVDASNLVMLELGNPIHFFDLHEIAQSTIRIRTATAGETLTTLDGVERKLDERMLVIADATRAVALAGVMGGADTEITESSSDVLIEAASFEPTSIRRTSRKLALASEASFRFARGVDPNGVLDALSLAVHWLVELAGGKPDPGTVDEHPSPVVRPPLTLRHGQLQRLLGYQPDDREIEVAFRDLGLSPASEGEKQTRITPPSWRFDLQYEADLVEEVARHLGYDKIPQHQNAMVVENSGDTETDVEERLRDQLSNRGFHESTEYSMIAIGADDAFVSNPAPAPIPLSNPLAESMAVLRRSVLPGLLGSLERNLRRGARDVRLFEIGHVFLANAAGELPREPLRVGIAWTGCGRPRHWSGESREVDLWDVAGVVEQLLGALRPEAGLERVAAELPAAHPGRSLSWKLSGGAALGWAGALHPAAARELTQPVFVAEVELDPLLALPLAVRGYRPVPRLGAVERDLALILTESTSYGDVLSTLRAVPPPVDAAIEPIDRYEGPPLADGEASLTVRVTLQPRERTLTEDQIEAYRQALVAALDSSLGIKIRS